MKERDPRIDTLRVIGTLLVILAHMGIPKILANIRTFDVVMLVFVSGLSFRMSHNNQTFMAYLKKRFFKLVIPTYFTILVIFILSFIVCYITDRQQLFSAKTIIHSFMFLNDGIGYIWITRVYFFIAVFCMIIIKIINSDLKYKMVLLCLLIGTLTVLTEVTRVDYGKNIILDSYVFDIVPYCLVVLLGMLGYKSKKYLGLTFWISLGVFVLYQVIYAIQQNGFCPDTMKYPPSIYYISYGLIISCLLIDRLPVKQNKTIKWISMNSFTIYLFHIVFLFAINVIADIPLFYILNYWPIKFVLVVVLSLLSCYLFGLIRTGGKKA